MLLHIKWLFAALTVCCMLWPAIAQDNQPARPVIIGDVGGIDGIDCETTMAVLDLVAQEARDAEKTVIIISRLGRGEASRSLTRLRLRNLRGYLYMTRGVEDKKIVLAEGERVMGLGKVEIYVEGKLHLVFHLKRNRDFWKGCGV